jgi:hypothetical protein
MAMVHYEIQMQEQACMEQAAVEALLSEFI